MHVFKCLKLYETENVDSDIISKEKHLATCSVYFTTTR